MTNMASARDKLKSDITRAKVRELLGMNMSLGKIAEAAGISYVHAKQIAGQEGAGSRPQCMRAVI